MKDLIRLFIQLNFKQYLGQNNKLSIVAMFTTLWKYVYRTFQAPGNALQKIILLQFLCYIFFLLVKIIIFFSDSQEIYLTHFYPKLLLPLELSVFIQQPWSIFTYLWIPKNLFELVLDSMLLFSFGNIIKHSWGNRMFILFYLVGGILSGMFLLVFNFLAPSIFQFNSHFAGAAGALYTIITLATMTMPNLKFYIIFIGKVPIKYITFVLIGFSLVQIGNRNGISYLQLNGVFIGVLLGYLLKTIMKRINLHKSSKTPTIHVSHLKVTYRKNTER